GCAGRRRRPRRARDRNRNPPAAAERCAAPSTRSAMTSELRWSVFVATGHADAAESRDTLRLKSYRCRTEDAALIRFHEDKEAVAIRHPHLRQSLCVHHLVAL